MGWIFFLIKADLPDCCCVNKLKYLKHHSEHTIDRFYPLLKTVQFVRDPGISLDFSPEFLCALVVLIFFLKL